MNKSYSMAKWLSPHTPVCPACTETRANCRKERLVPATGRTAKGIHFMATNALRAIVARTIYVLAQLALVAVLAWLTNPVEVGTFILAYAVTGPVFMLTNLQLRVVLATDSNGEFPFGSYFQLRLLTALGTFAALCIASGWIMGSTTGRTVLVAVALAKAIESVSDVYVGLLEREELIRVSSRSILLRGVSALAAFSTGLLLWHDLSVASVMLACAWGMILLLHDVPSARGVLASRDTEEIPSALRAPGWKEMASIANRAWPLGLAAMVMSLQTNFPRLWTGWLLGEEALGVFGVLFQIGVAGQVFANSLFCPLLPRIARLGTDGRRQLELSVFSVGVTGFLGLGFCVLLFATLGPLLRLVNAPHYTAEVLLIRLTCLIVPAYFIQTALASVQRAKRRFTLVLACESVTLVVCVAVSVLAGRSLGLVGPALAALLSLVVSSCVYLAVLIRDGMEPGGGSVHSRNTRTRSHRHAA